MNEPEDKLNPIKMTCIGCIKEWTVSTKTYYEHNNQLVGTKYYPLCKNCINNYLGDKEDDGYIGRVKEILQHLNRPWIHEQWIKSNSDWGKYMRHVSSLNNGHKTFMDSEFEITENNNSNDSSKMDDDLIEKWGNGYSTEEYEAFERKFDFLKKDYPLRNVMHIEALKKYCRYVVKEEFAVANSDFKAVEMYSKLASKAAEDAKINPKQFTKADLTDGIDSFGEMSRAVEKAVDVVEILPKFMERPNDKVDFTIWCYVNYERELHGLPLVEYKEIYKFIKEREKAYNEGTEMDEVI